MHSACLHSGLGASRVVVVVVENPSLRRDGDAQGRPVCARAHTGRWRHWYGEAALSLLGPKIALLLVRVVRLSRSGKVRAAFHRDTGFQVAVKIVEKASMKAHANMQRKLEREIAIMKLISHSNVLQLFEVFETADHLYVQVAAAAAAALVPRAACAALSRRGSWHTHRAHTWQILDSRARPER